MTLGVTRKKVSDRQRHIPSDSDSRGLAGDYSCLVG